MDFKIKRKTKKIKERIIDMDKNNQFIIKLPPEVWKDTDKLNHTVKELDDLAEDKIVVDDVDYNNLTKDYYYIVTVANLVKFAFTEKENGDISYIQIPLEEK